MLGDGHVRFGGRSAETERPKGRHRAAGRPYNLTPRQQLKLAHIQRINQRLYRAYLLKEQLRQIYRVDPDEAIGVLNAWLKWAWRCRLQPFVKLARTIRDQRAGIEAALRHRLSNARVERINTQIRLITRRGFGYHSQQAVIALAMLSLGGPCPPLPGRSTDPRNRQ
jgi:transposase